MGEFLAHHNVAFTEYAIDKDPGALKRLVKTTGARATPVIVIGDEVVVGFDRGRVQALLGIGQ